MYNLESEVLFFIKAAAREAVHQKNILPLEVLKTGLHTPSVLSTRKGTKQFGKFNILVDNRIILIWSSKDQSQLSIYGIEKAKALALEIIEYVLHYGGGIDDIAEVFKYKENGDKKISIGRSPFEFAHPDIRNKRLTSRVYR